MRRDPTLENLDVEERVRYLLRRIALVIDPVRGELKAISDKHGWDVTTLSRWQRRGGVPRSKARVLYDGYRRDIGFNLEDLVGNDDSE